MLNHPLLSKAAESGLARRIKKGDREAAHELVRHNARLAWTMAEQWAAGSRGRGADTDDLFSVAILALYKAAERFRPTKGSFARYAAYFVRDALRAEVGNAAIVRGRSGPSVDRRQVAMAGWQWLERTGAEATKVELATILCWTEQKVARAQPKPMALSLDAPTEGASSSLGERVCDESSIRPDEQCAIRDRIDQLRLALSKLDKRSQEVIMHRFGLGRNSEEESLREVGRRLGLSGERARQIERRALVRLRTILTSGGRPGFGANGAVEPDLPKEDRAAGDPRKAVFARTDFEAALSLTA